GLMALGVWVIRALKKSAKFIMYPMFFMLTTTIVALVQMLLNPKTNMVVFSFDLVLLVLTLLLLKEAYTALKKKDE
ncbi:MAG: carbon starvation protein A, partial [Phascolarctobacterium sp.]|nr:carbon starvation protein A [Phascolarctobacterium sp.]